MRSIRKTLLVEDHVLVRETLLMLLNARLPGHRWRESGTLASALRTLANEPDVGLVLLDLDLPDSTGLATLETARTAAPFVPIVVVSALDDPQHVGEAIERGAAGFISKTADADGFVATLERIMAGEVVLPASALPAAPAGADAALDLTERQRDVLRLLVDGQPNKRIASELDLSEATVKTHLQTIFRKLGVNTRTQAVLAAARLRLVL